jgi:mRNA interferase MazF
MVEYEPCQGDIIAVDFNPTKGREQSGKRPALVINNTSYFKKTGLLIICPVSNTKNSFPLHLPIGEDTATTGNILTQHIRTIDPEARPVKFIERVPDNIIRQVMNLVGLFFKADD